MQAHMRATERHAMDAFGLGYLGNDVAD